MEASESLSCENNNTSLFSALPESSNIYDHPKVFSLDNEDLRFCDQIKHTILTTSDEHAYLQHHITPPQLQWEVCKCLDTWLQQGIIRPSQSPYTSQVVNVCKKMGNLSVHGLLEA